MTIETMMDADLTVAISDLQDSVVWSGQTIPCTLSWVSRTENAVLPDGTLYPADLMLVARVAAFTSKILPANQDVVVVTSTRLGLAAVRYFVNAQSQDGIAATFYLRRN